MELKSYEEPLAQLLFASFVKVKDAFGETNSAHFTNLCQGISL